MVALIRFLLVFVLKLFLNFSFHNLLRPSRNLVIDLTQPFANDLMNFMFLKILKHIYFLKFDQD